MILTQNKIIRYVLLSILVGLHDSTTCYGFSPNARAFMASTQNDTPKLILIAGCPGTGKSTFGMSVALDQGILKCISTDTVRAVMRSFVGADVSPALHRSSYAPAYDDDDPVRSWKETCRVLEASVESLVDDAIERKVSLVVEGVHLIPSRKLIDKWEESGGTAMGCLLQIQDARTHKKLLIKRGFVTGNKHNEAKKLKEYSRVRTIQDEMMKLAEESGWLRIEQRTEPEPLDMVASRLYGFKSSKQVVFSTSAAPKSSSDKANIVVNGEGKTQEKKISSEKKQVEVSSAPAKSSNDNNIVNGEKKTLEKISGETIKEEADDSNIVNGEETAQLKISIETTMKEEESDTDDNIVIAEEKAQEKISSDITEKEESNDDRIIVNNGEENTPRGTLFLEAVNDENNSNIANVEGRTTGGAPQSQGTLFLASVNDEDNTNNANIEGRMTGGAPQSQGTLFLESVNDESNTNIVNIEGRTTGGAPKSQGTLFLESVNDETNTNIVNIEGRTTGGAPQSQGTLFLGSVNDKSNTNIVNIEGRTTGGAPKSQGTLFLESVNEGENI